MITDGWGGIDDAILDAYGIVPEYAGRGHTPSQPKPGKDWPYLQMVKQHNEHGRLQGIKLKAIWACKSELIKLLGKSTAYIERSNLTTRIFSARLTRKTLAFSKELQVHQNAVIWEDAYYNWIRPHHIFDLLQSGVSTLVDIIDHELNLSPVFQFRLS